MIIISAEFIIFKKITLNININLILKKQSSKIYIIKLKEI